MKTDREKEIDNLFRKGLDQPDQDMDFREGDWDAMEALLDEGKKPRGIVYWLPVIGSVAAMLLLVGGWFLYQAKTTGKNDQSTIAKTTVKPFTTGKHLHKDTTVNNQQIASVTTGFNTADKAGERNTKAAADNSQPKILTSENTAHYTASRADRSHNVKKAITNGSTPNERLLPNSSKRDEEFFQRGSLLADNLPAISAEDFSGAVIPQTKLPALFKPHVNTTVKSSNKPVIKQQQGFTPRLAITVLAAPDVNGVNTFKDSKVGTNAGLLFSIGLSKKFTISTGAIYSKKPYLTNFGDYHHNYVFKTDPETVTADCRVLDIPLNIDYQVYNKQQNKFSIGTGISSYFMLRENYHYNYEYAGTAGPTDYNIANKNQHIFGVLNLDVTYQHQLNSKFGVAIQPYMKVPLTDIGYGQVKLQTAGVAVGVTWNINPLSRR